jgi:hypothetical protein
VGRLLSRLTLSSSCSATAPLQIQFTDYIYNRKLLHKPKMSATNNNSATPPSYEAKARATLEVANRIHALPANITSADFTLAEVKSLSEMLLFLMALKENEGVVCKNPHPKYSHTFLFSY